jgi:hypothetical protein
VCEAFQSFLNRSWGNPKFRPFWSRNGSETAEKRLEKRPSFGQAHGQRFFYMWLPIVGSFIVIKVGGGESDQLA